MTGRPRIGSTVIGVGVLDEDLARQAVAPVDPHGVGAADAMRAGAAEGQRLVVVPLDLLQDVQHAVHGSAWTRTPPSEALVELGVVAPDAQLDVHRCQP